MVDEKNIFEAIEVFDVDRVKELLTRDPSIVHTNGYDGRTPLIHAVMNAMEYGRTQGHLQIEILKVLLEAGADPNALTHDGRNALGWAAGLSSEAIEVDRYDCGRVVQVIIEPSTQEVFKEIVTLLLAAGTDHDTKAFDRSDCQTKTMVEFARQDGRIRDGNLVTYLHGNSPHSIMSGIIETHKSKTTANSLAGDGILGDGKKLTTRPVPDRGREIPQKKTEKT